VTFAARGECRAVGCGLKAEHRTTDETFNILDLPVSRRDGGLRG